MNHFLLAFLIAFASVSSTAPAAETTAQAGLSGDWVGWAYLDEGGDFPLRLRIDLDGSGGLRVRFDELVARRYDLPVQAVEWHPPRLLLERVRPGGGAIRLDGRWEGEAIRGRIDWLGHRGGFELLRCPELLSRVAPERWEDLAGTYRLGGDRTLVVTRRFWGELLFTDVESGRSGTLFPVDTDLFFAGAAMYVPSPVHARVRFVREKDEPVVVEWQEVAGAMRRGERLALVEEEVVFGSDGVRLFGTLLRPGGVTPLPAAVIVGGSNWTDREANRRDASILASFGMATLIYDQRGFGLSGGERVVSFLQTARDAAAAVAFLRSRDDILSDQVGLTGRSRGGWIAPLAASFRPEPAFLVLFVPPAVSPAEQETTRRINLLEDAGFTADDREIGRRMLEAAWRYAATGEGWDDYLAWWRRAEAAALPDEVFEPAEPDHPGWSWTRLNMDFDPRPALESTGVPLLALFGEKDRNVVTEENLTRMRAALERGSHPDFQLVVVAGADHGLRIVPEGAPVPLHRTEGFGPSGWPEVRRWLARRIDLGGAFSILNSQFSIHQ